MWRWARKEEYEKTVEYVLLEIALPREVPRPLRAMEEVFAGFHAIHDVFTWKETWLEGEFLLSLSLEIVSIGGDIHFYIRAPRRYRDLVESNIYSQYPDAEISEVEDYTQNVPQDIPNENWDLFGFDEINTNEDPYPIKTYKKFESGREPMEEKRVDPLAGLLDGLATLQPGEQIWVQIVAKPIREDEIPWTQQGKELVDELAHRTKETKSVLSEAFDFLIRGEPPGKEKEEEVPFFFPEMRLTPGERDIVESIEEKISRFGFETNVRFLYLGKREVFFKPKARIPFGFFKEISTENMNGLKPWTKTIPKVEWILAEGRKYSRKRKLFRHYVKREPPLFPREGGTYVFNTEELATLYHFPGRIQAPAPTIPRVGAKKREAPPELPSE